MHRGRRRRPSREPTRAAAVAARASTSARRRVRRSDSPNPSAPLHAAVARARFAEVERVSFLPPADGDSSSPRALLCIATFAIRDGKLDEAHAALARALRPPGRGGLSEAWSVTEWARKLAAAIARDDAKRFLDTTREIAIDELGSLT